MTRNELLAELDQVLTGLTLLHAEFAALPPESAAPPHKLAQLYFLQSHLDDLAQEAFAMVEARMAIDRAMRQPMNS